MFFDVGGREMLSFKVNPNLEMKNHHVLKSKQTEQIQNRSDGVVMKRSLHVGIQ